MRTRPYTNLYVKRRILKLKIDIIQIITQGIISHDPKLKILQAAKKQIMSIAVQLQLSDREVHRLWLDAMQEYDRISKRSYLQIRKLKKKETLTPEAVKDTVYDSIRARIIKNDLIKETNQLMWDYEFRVKHTAIYGEGGLLDSATSPFFLASSHPKPAKDHANFEGKMYYDEDWEKKNEYSDAEASAIRAYIRNHKLQSVQWVLGAPVFLCTRRNCKHYMRNMPLNEVLHASARRLLQKHGMYMKDSNQPASASALAYREYYNRLKIEQALFEIIPNEKLKKDIIKDKMLLDKYRQ